MPRSMRRSISVSASAASWSLRPPRISATTIRRAGAPCASPPNIPRSRAATSPAAASRRNASSSTARWSSRPAWAYPGASSISSPPARRCARMAWSRSSTSARPPVPLRLDSAARGFAKDFAALLDLKRELAADVDAAVAAILDDVKARGAAEIIDRPRRFDKLALTAATLRLSDTEFAAAKAKCAPDTLEALSLAAARIEAYHRHQVPRDIDYTDPAGVRLGARWRPIGAVGIYVPGGSAAYPSSVLMNAVPAKVAGVPRVAMVVPAPAGALNPLVLAAAELAGVSEIYRIGGAQAIGALAYGTETIAAVDKIVGPGNAYVAAAKRRVYGRVGIDMIAGPSEILVLADAKNDPAWIAADLLSQAEHDRAAQAILMTDSRDFAAAVEKAVEGHLVRLPRADIAR